MIHIAETLSIRTVESFLKPNEIDRLNDVMDGALGSFGRDRYGAGRHTTIHEIPGRSPPRRRTSTSRPAGSR
ncbi:hypothetical protein [Streptomyces sp. I6]|uniref:hypothetical protein n=1 Tax=Streptomyces sp. I6 TaxID=2483113 RepID=UPI00288059B1|nr:hypothetical protein [Streptomyces sp. I6]